MCSTVRGSRAILGARGLVVALDGHGWHFEDKIVRLARTNRNWFKMPKSVRSSTESP